MDALRAFLEHDLPRADDGAHPAPPATICHTVRAPPADMPLTFYTRHGDWFAWACLVYALAGLLGAGRYFTRARNLNFKRKEKNKTSPESNAISYVKKDLGKVTMLRLLP